MKQTDWLYRSGDAFLPPKMVDFLDSYIIGDKNSLFYLNYWHINHFFSGFFFGVIQLYVYHFESPFIVYLVIHTLWELWQLFIGMTKPNLRGLIDITNDTFVGILGCFLALRLERKQ